MISHSKTRATIIAVAAGGLFATACRDGMGPVTSYPEQIAYTAIIDRFMQVVVANPDGSDPATLTAEMQTNLEATFSPDGSLVLFTSWRDGDANIWVMNRDGSNPRGLTTHAANDRSARFSPTGQRIAFVSQRDGPYEIYLMNPDGSGVVNLSNSPASVDWEPRWSPDGTKVLFCSTRGSGGAEGTFSLWTVNVDGTGLTRLPVEGGARWPAWSPDGSKIAFASARSGDAEIWVMNADGSNQVNVTASPGVDEEPFWSPDGSRILFTSQRDGSPDIYVMDADGSNQTNLTQSDYWVAMPAWSR
ncbi:MAG: TolB family protein [Gemmatimonadota bacterium]